MEWCVKSADQVRVLRSWEIDPDDYDSDDDDADEEELQEHEQEHQRYSSSSEYW